MIKSTHHMKLTILGSGTCVPTVKRASPGYYLDAGETKILIDCGPGTLRQITKTGLDYKDIDAVFLSHFHADHASDLFSLIQALSWTPDLKSKNQLYNRKKDLYIWGSEGFIKWFRSIQKVNGTKPRPNTFKIILKEFKTRQLFKNIEIETTKGNHSPSSSILKIKYKNKIFVYAGDTDYDENIIKLAQNTNLLILECSWPDEYKLPGHLTPSECSKIAMRSKAKKLLLAHFYPPMENIDIKKQVFRIYKGEIVIAKDLMEMEI